MALPHCFDYNSFVKVFEIRKCEVSSFVLFPKNCFDYLVSPVVPYKFRIVISISGKDDIGISIRKTLNL